MNKKTFVRKVTDLLRENDIKKPISSPKQVFHISDDEGNSKDFVVKKTDKKAIYTINDVEAILEACLFTIEDCLKKGEPVSFHGFGCFDVNYREPRKTKSIGDGTDIIIDGHYIPKFSFGNDLRKCAKIYELSLQDKAAEIEPTYDDSDLRNGA